MDSPVSTQRKHPRPYIIMGKIAIILGLIGSLVAIASFFFLPLGSIDMGGFHPHPLFTGWEQWQQSASDPNAGIPGLIFAGIPLACAFITFLIGCAGLVRPLPRLWVIVFTIAAWMGLSDLCLIYFVDSLAAIIQVGFWWMFAGYVSMLVERSALSRARRGA